VSNGNVEAGLLAGKVAAVTGATSGSGRAIAKLFVAEGADVVLLSRGVDRLKAMEEELGAHAIGIPTDVGDPDSVRSAFQAIGERFGKLDILINNAGIHLSAPFETMRDDQILAQVRTNFLGPVFVTRSAIPLLRAAGGGDVVNTSSESTIDFFPYMSIYGATKAGLEGLTRQLQMEYEKEEIRVTNLVQGVALGEGGGTTDWNPAAEATPASWERLVAEGTIQRVTGNHGSMKVEDVAAVHLFVVTRPRGQKLDMLRVRCY
jgi:NAD(P)-dependent dehydrogenase (short-subunit alcohol dehydrogenase family)